MTNVPAVASDPAICGGRPHVKGTHLTVEFVLSLLASGWSVDGVLAEYPQLTAADLRAVFAFGRDTLQRTFFSM
jgi:uncharacterized protein (DUF433 family)